MHMAISSSADRDPDYGAAFRTKANLLPEPADRRQPLSTTGPARLHAAVRTPRDGETMHFETPGAGGHAGIDRGAAGRSPLNLRVKIPIL
ncbi:hypothetical protein F2981_02780 [Sinorhizobium meliloti]|nr:hypothetical protein [Sinorhizobium meliloti]